LSAARRWSALLLLLLLAAIAVAAAFAAFVPSARGLRPAASPIGLIAARRLLAPSIRLRALFLGRGEPAAHIEGASRGFGDALADAGAAILTLVSVTRVRVPRSQVPGIGVSPLLASVFRTALALALRAPSIIRARSLFAALPLLEAHALALILCGKLGFVRG
jgi:hypothetical protein